MPTSRRTARKRPPKTKPLGGPRTFGRLQQALDNAAREEISAALKEAGGGVVAAAALLGISKVSLWRRMKALGITASG
jgi:transcriptional regulator of acetoin/glycerol metabolism